MCLVCVCALSVSALAFAKHEVLCKYLSINVFYLALFQFALATHAIFHIIFTFSSIFVKLFDIHLFTKVLRLQLSALTTLVAS